MRRLITFALVCGIMTACTEIKGTSDYQLIPGDKDGKCVLFYDNPEEYGGNRTEVISCNPQELSDLLLSTGDGWQYQSYPCTIKRGKVKKMDYGYLDWIGTTIIDGMPPQSKKYTFYAGGKAEREWVVLGSVPEVAIYDYSIADDGITVGQDEWKLISFSDSIIVFDDQDESKVYNPLNLKVWTRIILKK